MKITWYEIDTNDNDRLIAYDSAKYKTRSFVSVVPGGILFKQTMGITCLGITYLQGARWEEFEL